MSLLEKMKNGELYDYEYYRKNCKIGFSVEKN